VRKETDVGRATWAPDVGEKIDSAPEHTPTWRKRDNLNFDATSESDEFHKPPALVTTGGSTEIAATLKGAPGRFNSPPLRPGFVSALKDMLGPDPRPTPIQSLSMKWLLDENPAFEWNQFLLASETGSGKSIAYLLPLLQNIKHLEQSDAPRKPSTRPLNPRGIVLAPTHELSRQLAGFAKQLSHDEKLRVLCASRANTSNGKARDVSASEMAAQMESIMSGGNGEVSISKDSHPVDVLVGTPMKVMEMLRGRGWDRREMEEGEQVDPKSLRRGRDKMPGPARWRSKPELGLANVEWVVVDEADVLLGECSAFFEHKLSC
jgi:ATP-dependent RNA helicase MRH4